jgi:hypothetical protein
MESWLLESMFQIQMLIFMSMDLFDSTDIYMSMQTLLQTQELIKPETLYGILLLEQAAMWVGFALVPGVRAIGIRLAQ